MKLFTILCLAVAALASPHNKVNDARIMGGTVVGSGDCKFQAAVEIRGLLGTILGLDTFEYKCGGAILDGKTVLTTADCAYGTLLNSQVRVRVGTLKVQQGGQLFKVDKIIKHPDYNAARQYNNLAILKLNASITMGSQAAAINSSFTTDLTGKSVTVSGWGTIGDNLSLFPSTDLRKTTVPVFDWTDCRARYLYDFQENMFCGAGQDQGPCSLDEGGPAYLTEGGVDKLVGIISRSERSENKCGNTANPSIFMDIGFFEDFITDNLEPTTP